jgi:predicted secreted protein
VQRSTFTENVGYARFACDEVDCTDEAIEAMRRVFDYFMSEEGKAYDVHYRTIVHPRYEVM